LTEKPDQLPEEISEDISESGATEQNITNPANKSKGKSKKKDKDDEKSKKKKIKPAHVVICALILALAGVLTYFLWPKEEAEIRDGATPLGSRGTVITPDNIDELMANRDKPPPGGHYITTMNTNWAFDRWDVPSKNAYIENDIRNEFTVFFDLVLEEDNRLVYSSPYIPLGATLRDFALDRMVPQGQHPAIVTYYLVDDDGEEVSQVSVRVTLSITN